MRDALVGCTGFVGSNLMAQHSFQESYNSKSIHKAFGTCPDTLYYAGVPSEMFTANNAPEADAQRVRQAMDNISKIHARRVVLISTVAVYPTPKMVDEDTCPDMSKLTAYGRNRFALEQWVEENCSEYLIVRLPAIYGLNQKKNFIYDYIHRIPALLKNSKYAELAEKAPILGEYYSDRGDGFYSCRKLEPEERTLLKDTFNKLGFTALNFTDSRSVYQFYPLRRLWDDISLASSKGIKKLNLVTPPVSVAEVFEMLEGRPFKNELPKQPFDYDVRTSSDWLFGREDGYIMSREEELKEVEKFVLAANCEGKK